MLIGVCSTSRFQRMSFCEASHGESKHCRLMFQDSPRLDGVWVIFQMLGMMLQEVLAARCFPRSIGSSVANQRAAEKPMVSSVTNHH